MDDDHATIRRLLGDMPVQPLGGGLDHRVYAVGEALVARFGGGVEREAALLRAIAPRLPLPVPAPVAVEAGCMIQARAPGMPLLALPRTARRAFVPQLVAFADALHTLDPGVEVPEESATLEDWLAEARVTAAPPPAPARVLIHGDLGAEHIFVDGGRITGVIDWGDAAIGDPGLDHGRLLRDFGPIGRGGERARLYAVCTALEDLAYGHGAALEAVIKLNCGNDPYCDPDEPSTQQVASATFDVGAQPKTTCHRVGQVDRCRTAGTYRDPASWSVSALLDDLLGPDGATSEADPYFERAFRHDPAIREDWELDDNTFYGFPDNRAEAIRMAAIVDRVLSSGPYHATSRSR